jgi:threonine dehydrogenase-like Zn-dependent dehydrogenase
MKGVTYTARNEVSFIDLSEPTPGPGEVLVKVRASGICHTDYEVLKANYGTGGFPLVPGHEYAGIVQDVGSEVTNLKIGDRVVVDPNFECHSCKACQRGWAHLCENLGAYGVTKDGGFAEFSLVKRDSVHLLGDMTFSRAALAEPMGCVLNGVDAVHAPWMEEALIFGAGPMGLLMGMALKVAGLSHITFCDILEHRLDLAEQFGFNAVASGSAGLNEWRHRADLVVEATGVTAVAAGLTDYMANGARGLFFGVCPSDAHINVSPFEVFRRQLTLAGTHSLNHNIPRSLEVIDAIGSQIDQVVSHKLPLQEIAHFLATSPPDNSLKVQWVPE